jgi:hypothetical protein
MKPIDDGISFNASASGRTQIFAGDIPNHAAHTAPAPSGRRRPAQTKARSRLQAKRRNPW